MDMHPEKIHDFLTEAGLQSTVSDLQNPTKEYVLNILEQFLHKFSIDAATIKKPTAEQIKYTSLIEDCPEIISLINIFETMAGICNQIITKDKTIYFTDLTSPMPKKTRVIVKALSNFLLYVINKNALIEDRLKEIRLKHQKLEEIKEERNRYIELASKNELEKANKLKLKNQMETEIAKIRNLRNARKAEIAETEEKLKAIEKEKLEIMQYHEVSTANAIKMQRMVEDVASRVVKSPERYQSRLTELNEQKKKQEEKRDTMQDAIISKKTTIERVQSHLAIVAHAHAKISETIDDYKRLQQFKTVPEEKNKKKHKIEALLKQEAMALEQESSQGGDEKLQIAENHCEQHLASLHTGLKELLNKKKCLERLHASEETRQQKICSERDDLLVSITKIQNETKEFLENCQKTYDREVSQERKLRESLN